MARVIADVRAQMKSERWVGAVAGIIGIFLLIEGGWTAWAIDGVRDLEVVAGLPFTTAEDVAWAKSYLPAMYVIATEGLFFGVIALVAAVGLLMGRLWARRMLLAASVLLVLAAGVTTAMAPNQWDTQGVCVLFCLLLWWKSWKQRRT